MWAGVTQGPWHQAVLKAMGEGWACPGEGPQGSTRVEGQEAAEASAWLDRMLRSGQHPVLEEQRAPTSPVTGQGRKDPAGRGHRARGDDSGRVEQASLPAS